jgi:hypothetical protein
VTGAVIVERRRFPRSQASSARLFVPAVHEVRVIDVSKSGLLFSCEPPLAVGQRAQIRLLLERRPFTAWIEVVRVEAERRPTHGTPWLGARFVAVDENSGHSLDRFLALSR